MIISKYGSGQGRPPKTTSQGQNYLHQTQFHYLLFWSGFLVRLNMIVFMYIKDECCVMSVSIYIYIKEKARMQRGVS